MGYGYDGSDLVIWTERSNRVCNHKASSITNMLYFIPFRVDVWARKRILMQVSIKRLKSYFKHLESVFSGRY